MKKLFQRLTTRKKVSQLKKLKREFVDLAQSVRAKGTHHSIDCIETGFNLIIDHYETSGVEEKGKQSGKAA